MTGRRRRRRTAHGQRQSLRPIDCVAIAGIVLTTACTRPGRPPAEASTQTSTSVPAGGAPSPGRAGALPRANLSLTDRASWRPILKWSDECESAFQASHAGDDPGLGFHVLEPQLSVVAVVCAAGSYQPSSTIIRFDERPPVAEVSVVRFPVYEAETGATYTTTETDEVWGELVIDPEKAIMTVTNLARQTGDCGIWTRYDIASNPPAVMDARARLPCPSRAQPPVRSDIGRAPLGWRAIPRKG
jgi:hypothetical protein